MLNIRKLEPSNLDKLLELYEHLHVDDVPLPQREQVESVAHEFFSNQRILCFGGYIDDVLVSSCTLTIVPNLTRGCKPYGLIENVVTNELHRKRGYGTAILKHALAHAWSNECYKVMLMTGRKDVATLRFYESAGFDRNGKQAFIAKPSV
jgi:GNAT superfamily N-acetyltransferase